MSAMPGQRAKFTSPFAPLALSEQEAESLEQLSRVILHNYVAQYEAFELQRYSTGANSSGGGVDERVWKPVKQRDGVRVFAQRRHQSDGRASSDSDSVLVSPDDLPVLLIVGAVDGTLDDLMYGVMSPSIEMMRVKTTYIDDYMGDAALLETLATPTQDDPFQSLVIKWVQSEQGRRLRPAVSNRDFVYMERTGIAYTSTGERVGFHLMHSVHFPQTHELPPFVRGNVSVCSIFRQKEESGGQVEIYMRGTMDARGSVIRPIVVMAAADLFIYVLKLVECSHRKKLLWRLARRKRQASVAGPGGMKKRRNSSSVSDDLGLCATCKRSPSVAGRILSDARKRKCALCAKYVCSSCKIKKTLSQVASATGMLWQRELAFCGGCYAEVTCSDAFAIAQQELALLEAAREDAEIEVFSSVGSDCYSPTNSE